MVKGVSKRVIVVNNTGNKFFEKIVFYVTPEYGNMKEGQLNSAAAKYISTFDFRPPAKSSLRRRYKRRMFLRIGGVALAILAVIGIALAVIL